MKRLIKQSLIDKYLVKELIVNDKNYRAIFKDTGKIKLDTHIYEIGFSNGTEQYTDNIFLPSISKEGLLQRNRTIWYPVNIVIPPLRYRTNQVYYLNGLLNTSMYASSLSEFYPEAINIKPQVETPLYKSLFTDVPEDTNDLRNWNCIDLATAIIEMFNYKIVSDIRRSNRGGFQGISASTKSINTLIRAFCRYHGKDDEEFSNEVHLEDITILGRRKVEAKRTVLVMHPMIHDINIPWNSPLDFCACSPSLPLNTAQMKIGIKIKNHRFVGNTELPYSKSKLDKVGLLNNDPHRIIVANAISRSMIIDKPDTPIVTTSHINSDLNSVSLPGIRMTHPLNFEDGIVVSRTFANKMGAYKIDTDRITVAKDTEFQVLKEVYSGIDYKEAAVKAFRSFSLETFIVKRHDCIGLIMEAEPIEVMTSVKNAAVLIKLEKFEPANDLSDQCFVYLFTYITFLPLSAGDKIADSHGNKCTISAILPDLRMPLWKGIHCHYIATPYVMKRLALGAEIEDKLCLIALNNKKVIHPLKVFRQEEINAELQNLGISYVGDVKYERKNYPNVPISYRRMYRLDNNSLETLSVRSGISFKNCKRTSKNIKLGLEILTFISRGAYDLVRWLIDGSKLGEYFALWVKPLIYSLVNMIPEGSQTFIIDKRLPVELLGNPFTKNKLTEFDLEGTVCDKRIIDSFGIIRHQGKNIIIPPLEPFNPAGIGYLMVDAIAIAANRIIAEIVSEVNTSRANTNVSGKIENYRNTLAGTLAGKKGRIAKSITPVFPISIRAVITPFLSNDPLLIAIPRKSFNKLLKHNPKMMEIYKAQYCILKRDPIHREQNVIGVRYILWDNPTIGLNPVLVRSLDGDFDGDTAVALFPDDPDAFSDIQKLIPDFTEIFSPGKQLYDANGVNAIRLLKERIGIASTFDNPHESDECKNGALRDKLIAGISLEDLSEECVNAAKDFHTIKSGTAFTGALALRFIYSRKPENRKVLQSAFEFYHLMAQDTLNAKSGTKVSSLEVLQHFNSGNIGRMTSELQALGLMDTICIPELIELSKSVKASGGMQTYLLNNFPVLAAIQRNAGLPECLCLAKKIINEELSGDGYLEQLFDYVRENPISGNL